LIRIGIQKGDRVAVVSENRPEWCLAYFAISLSGGIAIPIDAQLGADEIKNLLADSEAKAVFHSKRHRSTCGKLPEKQVIISR